MTQEHKEAATRFSVVRVALYGESVDGMADVDTSAVRRLRKQALDMQVDMSRAMAVLALGMVEGSEDRAIDLVSRLPNATRLLQFLANPVLAADVGVDFGLDANQIRSIQTRLKETEFQSAIEALQKEWTEVLEAETRKATTRVEKQEKAEEKQLEEANSMAGKYPRNVAGRTVFLPIGTRVKSRYSGGGTTQTVFIVGIRRGFTRSWMVERAICLLGMTGFSVSSRACRASQADR